MSLFFFVAFSLLLMYMSFIFSGAEVSIFSLDNADLKKLEISERGRKMLKLLQCPKELLASLLIANTITNLLLILLINIQLNTYFRNLLESSMMLEFTRIVLEIFVIVLFVEVLPKIYASKNNIQFVLFSQPTVAVVYKLCYKISIRLNKFSSFLEKQISDKYNFSNASALNEIKHAINLTSDRNKKKDELLMINSIMEFKNKTVKQVMKSRLDIKSLPVTLPFSKLKKEIIKYRFSRLPIYKKNLDNIVGMLHTKDLLPFLKEKSNFKWSKHLKNAMFIIENQTLETCLKQMKEEKSHIAIAIDEFGNTQGLVSFEDIVEEIVGDIRDEFDTKERILKKTKQKNTHDFDAKISLQDFANFYGIESRVFDDVRKNSDSLGGLLLEFFGEIPQVNRVITWKDFKFTVTKVNKTRILKVRIKK